MEVDPNLYLHLGLLGWVFDDVDWGVSRGLANQKCEDWTDTYIKTIEGHDINHLQTIQLLCKEEEILLDHSQSTILHVDPPCLVDHTPLKNNEEPLIRYHFLYHDVFLESWSTSLELFIFLLLTLCTRQLQKGGRQRKC